MTSKLLANSVIYDKLNISVISKSIPKWKINEILDYHGKELTKVHNGIINEILQEKVVFSRGKYNERGVTK